MRKIRLFTPGPTPLIPEAQLAQAKPLIHHRTPEFRSLLLETRRNLQQIFRTESEVLVLASSGTGAMEAAVANLHAPGEKVLAVVAGKFGERWAELAKAYGLECVELTKEYGEAASAEEIVAVLRREPGIASVLLQGCETSTATAHDLEKIGAAVRREFPDVLIIVDAITTLACQEIQPDAWGLDVVIGGSQKAFGMPPGLAFLSLSPRAVKKLETVPAGRRYYFDLRKELKNQVSGSTAYTPAISLIVALNEVTRRMLEEGLDNIIAGAELMAHATRRGLEALGFRLLSTAPANAVTAAFPPEGVDADGLRKELDQAFGVKVAGGQGKLKGQIIRIAHLGYFDSLDVVTVLAAVELALRRQGRDVEVGRGVGAALAVLAEATASFVAR
ncbi:MAG: alanine--glyoxylate aminotransferase family protein [Acidobacteriota bacterium]